MLYDSYLCDILQTYSMYARECSQASSTSQEPRTDLGIMESSPLAFQVSWAFIILSHRPSEPGSSLITLLGYINTIHTLRNVPHATLCVPGHPLLDGRMGAYGAYHRRYSPYNPLTPVNRKTSRTPSSRIEDAQEIFPTHKNLR